MEDFNLDCMHSLAALSRVTVEYYFEKLDEALSETANMDEMKADGSFPVALATMFLYGTIEWCGAHNVEFNTALNDALHTYRRLHQQAVTTAAQ